MTRTPPRLPATPTMVAALVPTLLDFQSIPPRPIRPNLMGGEDDGPRYPVQGPDVRGARPRRGRGGPPRGLPAARPGPAARGGPRRGPRADRRERGRRGPGPPRAGAGAGRGVAGRGDVPVGGRLTGDRPGSAS